MKVYFEDGVLGCCRLYGINYICIDAQYGPTRCVAELNRCRQDATVEAIYTNYVGALSTSYSWNPETKHVDIFLRHPTTQEWTSIDKFTDRELRAAQHIPHMYLAGVFSKIMEG
jgi:hypothetical protein